MCFLPRRALAVSECEIARAYKVAGTTIEPISFVVPRKAETFQSDIYPPALSSEPALTAAEFFSGKNAPAKLVNLEDQSVFSSSSSSSTSTTIVSPGPTRTSSAPAPEPVKAAVAPSRKASEPVVAPAPTAAPAPSPAPTKSASPPSPVEPKSTSPVLSKTISSATSASDAVSNVHQVLSEAHLKLMVSFLAVCSSRREYETEQRVTRGSCSDPKFGVAS